jgi:hypothetical protein
MRHTLALLLALALGACGSTSDGDRDMYASIEVEPAQATVSVALGSTATRDYAVYGVHAGGRSDITSTCTLGIDASFGTFSGATVTIVPHGGKTSVTALCGDKAGAAELAVNLVGDLVIPPAPANAAELFDTATVDSDSSRQPSIVYPLDGAVSPRNMPPIEVQWTAAANDLFKVTLTSTFVNVNVYTTSIDTLIAETNWDAILSSSAPDNLRFVVEGLAQATPATKFASAPVTVHISRDTIDRTAIYYWASSQGNIMEATFGSLSPPSLVKDDCTSCHSLNRAGTRIGYSRCVAGNCGELFAGFLKYDANSTTWVETVNANNKAIRASYSTFSPIGNPFATDDDTVAIVSTQTPARLTMLDPDTGAAILSNLEAQSVKGPGEPRSATMPDWSPDGTKVAFASTPNPGQWIDISDSRIAIMSYAYQNNQHVFGDPTFLVPDPIVLANGTYNSFFFPSFSSDGALIVFNAARSAWRNFSDARIPGQRLMLADAAGAWVTDMPAMNGGYVDVDITWARWAPTIGADYYWIVFSSQRDYGHKVTEANSDPSCILNGVRQCKQLWIGAVARNRLTGTVDPSAPPMWLPGQDIAADNISPFWSVPAGLQ